MKSNDFIFIIYEFSACIVNKNCKKKCVKKTRFYGDSGHLCKKVPVVLKSGQKVKNNRINGQGR